MANRYWVGGDGTWADTAHWSTSSGGAGGASIPTSADYVNFDGASGGGTVVLSSTQSCQGFDFRGFTGSVSGSGVLYAASNTSYFSSTVPFTPSLTTGVVTVYGGGATIGSFLSGSITLASDLTVTDIQAGYSGAVYLSLNTGVTLTAGRIYAYDDDFTCTGAGKIRLTGVSGERIIYAAPTYASAPTFTVNTVIEVVGLAGVETLMTFGSYAYSTGASGELRVVGNSTSYSIGAAGSASNYIPTLHAYPEATNKIVLRFSATAYVKSIKSTAGSAGLQNIFWTASSTVYSLVLQSASTACNSANFQCIAASGAAVSGTRVGDLGSNSGITFSSRATVYRIATGAYGLASGWSTSSGGSADTNVPLPQDTAVFDALTPSGTITIAAGINGPSTTSYVAGFSASAYTGTISSSAVLQTADDQITFGAGVTVSLSSSLTCTAATAQVAVPTGAIRLVCVGASINAATTFTTLSATGAVATNDYAITANLTLSAAASITCGTSAVTLTGLSAAAGATISGSSATFTTSGSCTLTLNGGTLPNLTVASATTVPTSATITALTFTSGSLSIASGTTFTATSFASPSPSASPPVLKCTTTGGTFTLATSGAKLLQNMSLQGVGTSGVTYWNALNCVNNGYNSTYILFNNNSGAAAFF